MFVAFMTEKGGAGKTTTALTLATALVSKGLSVTVFDCDPNQVAYSFYKRVKERRGTLGAQYLEKLNVVDRVNEDNIYDYLDRDRDLSDFIFFDLPGVGAKLISFALARSHFVVIPMQASEPDMTCAVRSARQIDDVERMFEPRRTIARRYVWTRIPAALTSKGLQHAENISVERKLQMFSTRMIERVAMRDMFFTGVPPHLDADGLPATTNAAANVEAFANEFLQHLTELRGGIAA